MTDLAPDTVELVACPARAEPAGRLREMAFRADAWTPDETATLERLFRDDVPIAGIVATLGRGSAGVRDKIVRLGLRRHSQTAWSPDEDAWLAREYGTGPAAALALDLGRSCTAVYARAGTLGLTEDNPPKWTEWEDAQLRAGFAAAIPVAQIATLIGRPLSGTITRASNMGLRHPNNPPGWTEAEAARAEAYTAAQALRDAAASRLEAEYPGLVARSLDLLREISEADLAVDRANAALPAGASRLSKTEMLARTRPGAPREVLSDIEAPLWCRGDSAEPAPDADQHRVIDQGGGHGYRPSPQGTGSILFTRRLLRRVRFRP